MICIFCGAEQEKAVCDTCIVAIKHLEEAHNKCGICLREDRDMAIIDGEPICDYCISGGHDFEKIPTVNKIMYMAIGYGRFGTVEIHQLTGIIVFVFSDIDGANAFWKWAMANDHNVTARMNTIDGKVAVYYMIGGDVISGR